MAADGSQKIPQRILNPIRERMNKQLPFKRLGMCIAAWMLFISARTEDGAYKFELNDPLSINLRKIVADASSAQHDLVAALFELDSIFGSDLAQSTLFTDEVHLAFKRQTISDLHSELL